MEESLEQNVIVAPQQVKNDKRERKHTAQMLPPGITQSMMKKYVVYYREFVNLKNGKRVPREYFKVESHPKMSRPWISSKSCKFSLQEKLESANQIVVDLEKKFAQDHDHDDDDHDDHDDDDDHDHDHDRINPTNRINLYLPKYTKIRIIKQDVSSHTYSLVYDQKDNQNGFRWTCSHTFRIPITLECPNPVINMATISLELQTLKDKLYDKYAVDVLSVMNE